MSKELNELKNIIPEGMTVEELLSIVADNKEKKSSSNGVLNALQNSTSNQLILGAVLGALATYILSNDEIREKIVRSAVKLYTDVAGGMEELKEQVADIQAEMSVQDDE